MHGVGSFNFMFMQYTLMFHGGSHFDKRRIRQLALLSQDRLFLWNVPFALEYKCNPVLHLQVSLASSYGFSLE